MLGDDDPHFDDSQSESRQSRRSQSEQPNPVRDYFTLIDAVNAVEGDDSFDDEDRAALADGANLLDELLGEADGLDIEDFENADETLGGLEDAVDEMNAIADGKSYEEANTDTVKTVVGATGAAFEQELNNNPMLTVMALPGLSEEEKDRLDEMMAEAGVEDGETTERGFE